MGFGVSDVLRIVPISTKATLKVVRVLPRLYCIEYIIRNSQNAVCIFSVNYPFPLKVSLHNYKGTQLHGIDDLRCIAVCMDVF